MISRVGLFINKPYLTLSFIKEENVKKQKINYPYDLNLHQYGFNTYQKKQNCKKKLGWRKGGGGVGCEFKTFFIFFLFS